MTRRGLLCAIALAVQASLANAETPVERGSYLVNSIMTCGNCHTPRGPGGALLMEQLSGGLRFDEPVFDVTASNITPDKETGIGNWSDADIKKLMTTGIRPDGVQVAPIMPFQFYKAITPRDLDAIVAYLRSIPAVKNQVPTPVYKVPVKGTPYPDAQKPVTEAAMRDPLARGRYLAMIGHCMECHTPMAQGHHQFDMAMGKGGMEFPGPWGKSVASNITSSKTSGLGNASDADIKRAITQGIGQDGRKLKPPMAYDMYARMTEEDLNALVVWVRSLPPKD
jgi:mono/diheme cytochrome c family protein